MKLNISLSLLLTSSFLLLANTHSHGDAKCAHNKLKIKPEILEVEEATHPGEERLLQTATYPNIRITADYTYLTYNNASFVSYVKEQLLPPVIDYYTSALRLIQPITTLKISSSISQMCGVAVPSPLKTGVLTDFYLIVSSSVDSDNWVASASTCFLSSTTKRPIIAQMLFNTYYTQAADGDVLAHEKNMYLTMHEMLHALGFAISSYPYFLDANGNTRTGHIKNITLNGSNYTVLDVEPLTSRLRAHFGCSTLEGAYMEDDGGDGTAGSHFERRQFLYEVMTSGVIHGRRISNFSLSLLEGSGWYLPNYTYAEPFYFGQGEGCSFIKMNCSNANGNFEEFCPTVGARGCNAVGRGGGICSPDSRSDGCNYFIPDVNLDCENPDTSDYARFPELQVFGRGKNSKCFDGNLTKLTKSASTTFCFNYTCVGSGLTTKLNVLVGNTTVTCTSASDNLKVSGYNGNIYCPDPLTFCNTAGRKYCPRNCMGRGDCINGVCKCKTGYKGVDCALPSTWSS